MTSDKELYLGIMSGTSLDGIDAVLVQFTAERIKLIGRHYQSYPAPLKHDLLKLHHPSDNELHQAQVTSNELAQLYATAVAALLHTSGIPAELVRAIGCHGQTIRHNPGQGYTLQLGSAAVLAELSGITVVNDFRSRDIAAGGQGAPLVPVFHHHFFRHPNLHRVIVNIGGISNLTNLPVGGTTTGFDCGPGNLLMDAWVTLQRGEAYDRDGAWASSGTVIPALLNSLLAEPYLHLAPPKSSGRDLFNLSWLQNKLRGDEAPADVQATLLALSSHAIADSIQRYCVGFEEVYLCGGGSHNVALVQHLRSLLPNCPIQPTDVLGIDADWLEAIAFAWLAQQAIHGRAAGLPAVTGASHARILGAIYQA